MQFTTRDCSRPVAWYGSSKSALDYSAPATTATYTRADVCPDSPAATLGWLDPGLLHTATLSGLQPGQRYFYQVGCMDGGASGPAREAAAAAAAAGGGRTLSAVYDFQAPPAPGPDQTVHILALADQVG